MPSLVDNFTWFEKFVSLACKENKWHILKRLRLIIPANNSVIIYLKCLWNLNTECLGVRLIGLKKVVADHATSPRILGLLDNLSISNLLAKLCLQVCACRRILTVQSS